MELDAGCVGGIVHKGVHAGLIFSTEGEDHGESISFLEDRLGFQWNRVIAAVGGAAILLEMPLNPDKKLSHLVLETLSNDVVIGLMGITLQR